MSPFDSCGQEITLNRSGSFAFTRLAGVSGDITLDDHRFSLLHFSTDLLNAVRNIIPYGQAG